MMPSKSIALKCVATPKKEQVYTNFIYLHKDQLEFEQQKPGERVFFALKARDEDEYIFRALSDPKMEMGSIALNRLQRTVLRASLSTSMVNVRRFQVPKYDFELEGIDLEIKLFKKGYGLECELDGPAVINHLKVMYSNQIFRVGQEFVFNFEGSGNLIAKISSMDHLKTGDLANEDISEPKYPNLGMFLKTTEVTLVKSRNSGVKFTGIQSSAKKVELFQKGMSFQKMGIGGLDVQLSKIFRRAFASRIYPPEIIKKLGVKHIKGILLYGPPGTGKTLMARQIGQLLNAHEPKVINGPEVLDKYVGESEKKIRDLFEDAEKEQEEKGDESDLHLIIFDEIDAICRSRGSGRNAGVNDSVVNQLLSKIDGVNSLNNVLIIGMTNRVDLIDEALRRPGRFEVLMEIGLPDEKGRNQILNIHTGEMKKNKALSDNVDLSVIAKKTRNYSGAELEGVVKSASSFALNRHVDLDNLGKTQKNLGGEVKVSMEDFEMALTEVLPAFGKDKAEYEQFTAYGMIEYGPQFQTLKKDLKAAMSQLKQSKHNHVMSVLLTGEKGSGKTALAVSLASGEDIPFIKVISPNQLIGFSEGMIATHINKVFHDAYKSTHSVIVLDDIERLIRFVDIGPHFSNQVLQTLLVLLKKPPPNGRKLFVFGTTSLRRDFRRRSGLDQACNLIMNVPNLESREDVRTVLKAMAQFESESTIEKILKEIPEEIGIKTLLLIVETSRAQMLNFDDPITYPAFTQALDMVLES